MSGTAGAEIRFTKWGGKRHWRYPVEPLGTDRHGWWLGGRAGILVRRGFEEPIRQPHDFVTLIPATGTWIASFNGSGVIDTAVYVDVTTAPGRDGDVVHAVDLDLDVIRRRDGTVEVLDEDEFAEHQVLYGYPPEVIAQALATTETLRAMVTAGTEPFGTAADSWLGRLAAPRA